MRQLSFAVAGAVLVACGGSSASIGNSEPTPTSTTTPAPTDPSAQRAPAQDPPSPTSDPKLVVYEPDCDPSASPLTGTLTSTLLGFSAGYPASWNDATTQNDLPTLLSWDASAGAPVEEQGRFTAGRHYTSNDGADPIADIRGEAGSGIGSFLETTLGGHRGASWWSREPAPALGCASCDADPGPDIITIGLGIAMGGREILVVRGTASVTAKPRVFCDIQAILTSIATQR